MTMDVQRGGGVPMRALIRLTLTETLLYLREPVAASSLLPSRRSC